MPLSKEMVLPDEARESLPPAISRAALVRERKIRAGLAAFGILVSLFCIEVAYRVLAPRLAAPKWRGLPSTYFLPETIGPAGDFPYAAAKPANTYRIVVIGDSFSHGGTMQLFDTFPKRLERYLNLNARQPHVEVINYSKPGVATVHEKAMVSWAVKHLNPDLVLLEITLNDPETKPYRSTHSYQDKNGQVLAENSLYQHWKSLGFIMERLYATKLNAEYIQYYKDIFAKDINKRGFRGAIRSMKAIADERNVDFAAVIFPLFSFPFNERYPFNAQHEQIHAVLDEHSIPWLDLFDAYHNMPPDRLQAIPYDNPHPNEIANRIAADKIVEWFREDGLVPAEIIPVNAKDKRPQLKGARLHLPGAEDES